MTVKLRPEQEQLVSEALNSGAYQNPDEVIGRALEMLAFQDRWLREHRDAIEAKISRGLQQLDRGEGIPGDVSRARLQKKKAAWQAKHKANE